MRKTMIVVAMLFAALACAPASHSQDDQKAPETAEAPVHFYHLTFTVQELGADGKPVNSRSYSTTISTDKGQSSVTSSIRTGSKVPIPTYIPAGDGSGKMIPGQPEYIDVGINFDIRTRSVREHGHSLSFEISGDVSSYTPTGNSAVAPIIRHNSWNSTPVLIPIGKPTIIFSSDSLESKGAMQVVVTATPIAE